MKVEYRLIAPVQKQIAQMSFSSEAANLAIYPTESGDFAEYEVFMKKLISELITEGDFSQVVVNNLTLNNVTPDFVVALKQGLFKHLEILSLVVESD